MSSPTVSQIMAQRSQFSQAYYTGQITQQQYDTAMSFTSKQLQALQPAPTQNPTQPTQQAPAIPNPNPPDQTSPVIQDSQGAWIQTGSTLIPVTQHNPETPLQKTVTGYIVTPPPQENNIALEEAKQQQETATYAQTYPRSGGSTNPLANQLTDTGQTIQQQQIIANLTPQQKTEFSAWKQQKTITSMTDLGTFLAAGAIAPAIGPVAATSSALLGVGINQGFKTVQGGGLLTPREALTAAETGIIFSGVGKAAYAGIGASPLKGLIQGVGQGTTKTASGIAGRTIVNTGIGAAGGYVISGGKTEGAIQGAAFGAAFGLTSEAIGAGSKFVKQRTTDSVSRSYEKTLGTTDLWQPTLKEQVLMKITGAKPNSPTTQAKATELLSESYKKQFELNESILTNKPMPDNITGRTGLEAWTPNIKEIEIMTNTGAQPKIPASSINTVRTTPGESYSLTGLKRQIIADDMFDFSFAPKTSMRMENVPATPIATKSSLTTNKLPLFFGLGTPTQLDSLKGTGVHKFNQKENDPFKEPDLPLEKGIPENQLAYDYHGKLSFKKPTAFEQIQNIKEPKQTGGKMKPLWESQGSKTSYTPQENISASPTSQITQMQPKTKTSNTASPQHELSISTTKQQPQNQFVSYTKTPTQAYYPSQRTREETETTYISVPNSGLKHPQQPEFMIEQTQKQNQRSFTSTQPTFYNNPTQITKEPIINIKQKQDQPQLIDTSQTGSQNITQRNMPITLSKSSPIITSPTIPIQKIRNTPTTPNPFIQNTKPASMVPPTLGSKSSEFGGNSQAYPNFVGLRSTKRQYDILTAEEFLGY